jgi:hypothetical protein
VLHDLSRVEKKKPASVGGFVIGDELIQPTRHARHFREVLVVVVVVVSLSIRQYSKF